MFIVIVLLLFLNFLFSNRNITYVLNRGAWMNIGKKLKELRVCKNLTQEELADRAELSKGFISQLERDLTSPSIATLVDILQCLGTDLKDFFHDETDDTIVFHQTDYFEKKDPELKNKIEWIIPNAQKNSMEPIRLTLEPGGSTYPDMPHEGEEFVYVIGGEIELLYGQERYLLSEGDSIYYDSVIPHDLHAHGQEAKILAVVYAPL